jgi:2-polyprenyl-3-methyl-5-hydroxy-6-metoxy-1,4-benzoquinol methylase
MNIKQTQSIHSELIEKEFRTFLLSEMENQGSRKSKQLDWLQYMMDTSRPEKIVKDLLNYSCIDNVNRGRALDIGCGFGSLLIALQTYFVQVCGIDIDELYVEWSKKRVPDGEVICGNAKNMPWSNESFDVVTSTDVFEHINYDEQKIVASELMRVLKPGGHGIVIVPNRFQILDEHNKVLFGTWLPALKRKPYVKFFLNNNYYNQCWERTGRGWRELFESQGFQVKVEPYYMKGWNFLKYALVIPPNRYKLYLKKSDSI